MPPEPKEIVNGSVNREKPLGVARRLKPAPLAFLLSRRLMGHFCSIVGSFVLAVGDTGQEFPTSRPVAAQLVRHQPARNVS